MGRRSNTKQHGQTLGDTMSTNTLNTSTWTVNECTIRSRVDEQCADDSSTQRKKFERFGSMKVKSKRATAKRRLSRCRSSTTLLRCKSETAVNKMNLKNKNDSTLPSASQTSDLPGRSKSQILFQLKKKIDSKAENLNIIDEPFYNQNNKNKYADKPRTSSLANRIRERIVSTMKKGGKESKRFSSNTPLSSNKRFRRAQSVMTYEFIESPIH